MLALPTTVAPDHNRVNGEPMIEPMIAPEMVELNRPEILDHFRTATE